MPRGFSPNPLFAAASRVKIPRHRSGMALPPGTLEPGSDYTAILTSIAERGNRSSIEVGFSTR